MKIQIINPDSALGHLIEGVKRLKHDRELRNRCISMAFLVVGYLAVIKFI